MRGVLGVLMGFVLGLQEGVPRVWVLRVIVVGDEVFVALGCSRRNSNWWTAWWVSVRGDELTFNLQV